MARVMARVEVCGDDRQALGWDVPGRVHCKAVTTSTRAESGRAEANEKSGQHQEEAGMVPFNAIGDNRSRCRNVVVFGEVSLQGGNQEVGRLFGGSLTTEDQWGTCRPIGFNHTNG
jgi:hypothetical protein